MFPVNSQNLQHHLWLRESNWKEPGQRHPTAQGLLYHERNFYKSITPSLSVQNVDKPLGYLRKFTPDGQQLLAFSHNQRALLVYQYQGVGNAAFLLENQTKEFITASDCEYDSLYIRQELFNLLFMKQYTVQLIHATWTTRHVLNREFSLFLENGKYVLVASVSGGSIFPSYTAYEEYHDMFDDAELYDYTFHLIDLHKGCIVDSLLKPHDYIVLSRNHSVSLHGNTLAILSTYRQSIDILELDPSGKLRSLYTVGPYGSSLDRDRIKEHARMCNNPLDHNHSYPLTHLKQKILTFMYKEAMAEMNEQKRKEALKVFYKCFGMIESMLLLKMQLVDADHLLLRYERRRSQLPSEIIMGGECMIGKCAKIYIIYNMTEQKILQMYDQNSTNLLQTLRDYCDEFRNIQPTKWPWLASSPSNNVYFRKKFDGALQSIPGGLPKAAAHFNQTFPISAQNFSTSPYLDYTLFNYNDRFISAVERPRIDCLEPIPITERNTGLVKFRVYLEITSDRRRNYDLLKSSDLVSYIFHPFEPFFISVQKYTSRYCINFHIYNTYTKVAK